ncbi:MAG: hypothetical protein JRI22_12740 [Deltaproteobacteria bacterium]|nr:hypothetical protein [Deltaproteobacteria bacterium]
MTTNLKSLFGHRYRISHDPAWKHEKPEFRKPEYCYYVIPAKYGEFSPDGDMICFWCAANRIKTRFLREIPESFIHQHGGDECTIIFSVDHFHQAAEIARARKRRVLSEKQRKIQAERLAPYRFQKREIPRSTDHENGVISA